MSSSLVVPRRFNGPPSSGNGGWSAGALAELAGHTVGSTATVQLRQPPPLETPMPVEVGDDGWTIAVHGDSPALKVRAAERAPTPVDGVPHEEARAAEARYAGHRSHPFPGCFVCGVERTDGLRIFPGRVADDAEARARVATTWTPEEVTLPMVWAALDCIGGWAGDLEERLMVLGTMTTRLDALPESGVEHVVVGLGRGSEGRKTFSSASLHSPDGTVLATVEHVWIAVDPATFA